MVASTPHTQAHDGLAALASRFVSVDDLPWVATKYYGIDMKILVEDPDTGLVTGLFRFHPGAQLPYHEHVSIEQSWILRALARPRGGRAGWRFCLASGRQPSCGVERGGLRRSQLFLKPTQFFLEDGENRLGPRLRTASDGADRRRNRGRQ